MKKNSLAAIAVIVLLFTFAQVACAQGAGNVRLDSSASGDYVGNGWNCRLLAYIHPTSAAHRVLEFQCTGPDNRQRLALSTVYGCPGGQPIPLTPYGGGAAPVLILTGSQPGILSATIDGAPVTLGLAQVVASPAPYSGCAAAQAGKPRG